MTEPTLESFFSGGGGKSLSWKDMPIGTTYTGVIKQIHAPQQATDPATGLPASTRQGKPRMQVRVDLATDYRDPTDPEDDGSRSLYIGGWMTGAVGDAMRKAGVSGAPQVGATLTVRLTERESNGPAVAPTNKFDAHYVPPSPAAGFFDAPAGGGGGMAPLGAPQQQAPVQQVPFQQPTQQPMSPQQVQQFMAPPQPNIAGTGYVQQPLSPEQVQQLIPDRPEALSEAAWNQMDDATKRSVAATMANVAPF